MNISSQQNLISTQCQPKMNNTPSFKASLEMNDSTQKAVKKYLQTCFPNKNEYNDRFFGGLTPENICEKLKNKFESVTSEIQGKFELSQVSDGSALISDTSNGGFRFNLKALLPSKLLKEEAKPQIDPIIEGLADKEGRNTSSVDFKFRSLLCQIRRENSK